MATPSPRSPYGRRKFATVNEYHAAFPPAVREKLARLRAVIRASAPQAAESISYNMPAFTLNGPLAYYAAYRHHIGFYPTPQPIRAFAKELRAYKTTKGAVQFPLDKPIPAALVRNIVRYRAGQLKKKAKE
jgi:uncharacterized protein YdhG (YjbR/CyaY superfamily)